MLDFLCISDLSTWVGAKLTYIGPPSWKNWETMKAHYGPDPCAITSYIEHSAAHQHQEKCFTPIGKTRKELESGALKSGFEGEWSEWSSWF